MVYLKSLVMDRFKSFKHAELLFSKGFTCIVGPNGSGKSNICDALLFGLGESSLGRLRAKRLEYLLSSYGGKRAGKTYVRMEFEGNEAINVTRAARKDGKSLYRINGKRATRQETLEMLSGNGIRADETNTITQGEINRFTELTPKERRELIDTAAGIKEFEYKKEESLKELEKVSQRISEAQVLLNERLGFLKELEAEKEIAEKYAGMRSRLASLNYGILLSRKAESEVMLKELSKRQSDLETRKSALASSLEALAKRMEQLNAERQRLTMELNTSAQKSGEKNAKLEAIRLELARITAEESAQADSASQNESQSKALEETAKALSEKISEGKEELASISVKLKEAEKKVKELGEPPAAPKDLQDLNVLSKKLGHELAELHDRVASASAEINSRKAFIEEASRIIEDLDASIKAETAAKASIEAEISKRSEELIALHKNAEAYSSGINLKRKELDAADSKFLELREQRSLVRPNELAERIRERFGKSGFHGKASELCSYDSKYAYAVEAAAGGRFDYLVVDNTDVAVTIIEYLKRNNLGRSTFIPISELNTRDSPHERSAMPIIDLIDFDPEYRKVFSYVFNNTYLIEKIEDAKRIGIGKHRYVTLSGDLVEQSGVVSGGSATKRMSIVRIEAELKQLAEARERLGKEINDGNNGVMELRKREAYAEMEIRNMKKEAAMSSERISKHLSEKASKSKSVEEASKRLKDAEELLSKSTELKESIEEKLNSVNMRLESIYNSSANFLGSKEAAEAEAARAAAEGLRIRRAELQKEFQMLAERISGIEAQINEKSALASKLSKQASERKTRKAELEKSRLSMEAEIANSSDSGKKIYARLSSLDSETGKAGAEHSKVSSEISIIERDLAELGVRKSQAETRLADLSAELSAYGTGVEAATGNFGEMEKEASSISIRLNEIGSVNMKAPEMYEEKKKGVDDSVSRLNTLESERQAVLKMMEEIESKKLQTFMATLNEVAKNFSKLYNYIFTGKASINLEDQKDPFNSGIEISISTERSSKLLSSMSGGERSLVSLILIFAIHMCKPSALYIFDEVDAALDKENSKKLSQLIREMSRNAQFIVVSHNDSLIASADVAIGVVKQNDESKVVGIEVAGIAKRKK